MSQTTSPWSIVSFVLLAVAFLGVLYAIYFLSLPVTAPADAAVKLFAGALGAVVAWLCSLAGTICAVVAVRRPRGRRKLAVTVLVLNGLICLLPVLWLLVPLFFASVRP
jgi:hypothetical protein